MLRTSSQIETVDQLDDLVLIAFLADWCPYSLLIAPAVETVAERIGCELRLVDVDESPEFTSDCNVKSLPTVLLYQFGAFIGRWEGQTIPEDIPEFFQNVCLVNNIQYTDTVE